ncbi:MAG: SDR family oxidoreductase [Sphingobium sp.]
MTMLAGQVAIVTGAGGGIGRGIVDRFVREGARVTAVDFDVERLEALAGLYGDAVRTVVADVADWDANRAVVETTLEAFGRLDCFVGNAGIFDHGMRLEAMEGANIPGAATELLGVNLIGYLLGVRASLDALRASKGNVILTGSFASTEPSGGGILYTISKHGVVGAVRQLAYELAPDIRVNGVSPGVAPTVLKGVSSLGQVEQSAVFPGTAALLPLARMPEAADFGGTYAFLASRDAAHITGSMLPVDSGLAIRGIA